MSLPQHATPITPLPAALPDTALMEEGAEMALLGGLLLNTDESNASFKRVIHLTEASFALPRNKRIWETMQSLYVRNIGINIDSVRVALGTITEAGERHFQDMLQAASSHLGSMSKILEEIETMRLYETTFAECTRLTRNRKLSLSEKTDHISSLVTDILIKASSILGPASHSLGSMTAEYHEHYLGADTSGIGIDTGYTDLNALMNGFERKRMYVIGAETGGGKSMLAQDIAFNLNRQGYRGLFISLELPIDEYRDRGMAIETQIDVNRLKQRRISKQEMERMGEAVKKIQSRGILHMVELNKPTIAKLKSKITELHAQPGIDFVVIDYIEPRMFSAVTKEHMNNPASFMGAISKELIDIAKALNIILFPLVQTTRASYQRGGKPTKEDLAGSAALGRDADFIAILKDETPFSVAVGFGETHLHIVKSRTGGEGEIVRLEARKNVFTFSTWRGL